MSRVSITDDIRQVLKDLHHKTGVGPQRLLKGKTDRPKGLSSTTIYHWMDGKTKTARQEHLDFVLHQWRNTDALEVFSESDVVRLDLELKRTGYTPLSLLRRLSPVPDGLTPNVIHRLRLPNKRLQSCLAEHKSFLFDGLKNLPDK